MAMSAFTDVFLLTLSNHEGVLHTGPVELVNIINRDVCDVRLLPTTVLNYPVFVSVAY